MSLFKSDDTLEGVLKAKTINPEHIEEVVANVRSNAKTIATLNGSFDLLHAGHLEILFQAAKQADVLFVLLNSDASIKLYKSPLRPIVPLAHRLKLMAALCFVDYVTWFDELDPRSILARIQPDVHVNGAEYGENCIEADVVKKNGGRIHIVSLVEGLSTSNIIHKIVTTCAIS
jgi:D-glycero-beta-D-manno-heptose 1-phosphate adenylyltransferase